VATTHRLPRAAAAIAELEALAHHARMPRYVARARAYRSRLAPRGSASDSSSCGSGSCGGGCGG
jgi:hypothetical protein